MTHVKLLRLSIILVLVWPSVSTGHWEDPLNCSAMQAQLDKVPEDNWVVSYSGISEDGRDYVVRFSVKGDTLKIEQHHILLPKSQWTGNVPTFSDQILSEWLDWDGDGVYGEWYLFPKGETDCRDALHFMWDESRQTYRLYATGKERT